MAIKIPPEHPLYYQVYPDRKPKRGRGRNVGDDEQVIQKPTSTIKEGYRYLFLDEAHPLKTRYNGRKVAEHRLVLWEKIGPGTHGCHWCNKPVTWLKDLQVDHIDWDKLNNVPDNLVPSCRPCNFDRHNPNRPPRTSTKLSEMSREKIRAHFEAKKRSRRRSWRSGSSVTA